MQNAKMNFSIRNKENVKKKTVTSFLGKGLINIKSKQFMGKYECVKYIKSSIYKATDTQ